MPTEDERLLDLIGEVHGLLGIEEFRRGLVVALKEAVPSDWVSINDVGPEPGQVWVLAEPELPAETYESFGRYMHQNPLVAHMTDARRRGAPVRLSDLTSQQEFHALEIYREVYRPIGLEYQIAFTLPREPPYLLGVALSRRRRDYTDGERDLLSRARPFLIQGYRNAVSFEAERGRGGAAMIEALRAAGLTGREAEATALVARGSSSADAAARLGVGVRTVDKHLQHAFAKLGVTTRSRAAAEAWRLAADACP
jgi:DNA-binding CsgD family transcriptional regulator